MSRAPKQPLRLTGKRVFICAGAGGVGKTTSAAAIALGLAAEGRRVAVVTIDPAPRLATALGLGALDNEPRRVPSRRLAAHGVELRGELWAMKLDPKRTFDELVDRLAPSERRRDEVLDNHIYRELSTAVAGSHEFAAVAKLYELDRAGGYEAIVLDTPPSRNALDFISAPARLTALFEARTLGMLRLAPAGRAAALATRVMGRGAAGLFAVLRRVTGVDLLGEMSNFFGALAEVLDGFNERAGGVARLLRDEATAFVLVSSPERESVDEAIAFAAELRAESMPLGGVIVNRVHLEAPEVAAASQNAALAALSRPLGKQLAAKVIENLEDVRVLVRRDRKAVARLEAALGELVLVPHLAGDVHDVAGLARVTGHLFG